MADSSNMLDTVLENLGNTAIYVIRQDNYQILYFNGRVKEVAPDIELGAVCYEVWAGSCDNCPLKNLGDKKTNATINYDDPFGEIVDLCATRIEWGEERIPAYLISVTPHMRSREELRHAKERQLREKIIKSTLDAAMAQMFEEIIYFNLSRRKLIFRRGRGLYGELREADGLALNRIAERIHPSDRAQFTAAFSQEGLMQAFESGKSSVYLECRRKGNDGSYRWFSTRVIRMDPTISGEETALALVSSIDERKKLESEKNELLSGILTLYEELFVLNLMTDKFFVYKMDPVAIDIISSGDYTEFNKKYGEDLIHPEDRGKFFDVFLLERLRQAVREGKEKMEVEVRRRDEEGNYRWCYLMASVLEKEKDGPMKLVLTFRDMDELRTARRKEQDANQRFITAVNNSYDAIYEGELYSDKLYIWKKEKYEEVNFKANPTISGQIAWAAENMIHSDYREEFARLMSREYLEREFRGGRTEVSFQVPRKGKGGWYRWYSFHIQLLEMTPTSLRIMYYMKDVDDWKKEEERKKKELRDALNMAKRANAAKTDFLSRMSHDIRTPMNAILGMAAIARENLEFPEKMEDCLDKIDISAQFLLSLINDVLDMSKIESGRMSLINQELDFYELMDGVKVICQNQAFEKQQKFICTIGPQVRRYYRGDSLRINQIIINLTSNAFKYTGDGGTIRLQVSAEEEKNGSQELCVRISDNGIGMSERFIQKMYEPFEQEHSGGGRVFEGTGLGLAITRSLLRMMGGTIQVKSELGKGTDFIVKFPLQIVRGKDADGPGEKTSSEAQNPGPCRPHFHQERILLVEDNAINREIAETLLSMQGLVIETAENGQIAVELFQRSAPGTYQAILMDIRMPVMDGLEATRIIREMDREDAAAIPIIAMTANAFQDEQKEALANGLSDYLTKPVDAEEMLRCLGRLLRKNGR